MLWSSRVVHVMEERDTDRSSLSQVLLSLLEYGDFPHTFKLAVAIVAVNDEMMS